MVGWCNRQSGGDSGGAITTKGTLRTKLISMQVKVTSGALVKAKTTPQISQEQQQHITEQHRLT
jgi:surface antigen